MLRIITSPNTSNYHHAGGGRAAIHDHTVHRRMGSLDVGHYTAGSAKSTGKDEYHIPHSDPPRRPTRRRLSGSRGLAGRFPKTPLPLDAAVITPARLTVDVVPVMGGSHRLTVRPFVRQAE